MSHYRTIDLGGDEAVSLREIETLLRRLNDAVGGGSMYGVYADDLDRIATRYDRAAQLIVPRFTGNVDVSGGAA